MPAALVKTLAEEKGVAISEAEKRWEKAKQITQDERCLSEKDGESFWKYVVGVFKKSMGVKEKDSIEESAGSDYAQGIGQAKTFQDIIAVFAMLFRYQIKADTWEAEYRAAKKYLALDKQLKDETDIERSYEIYQQMREVAEPVRYGYSFSSMIEPATSNRSLTVDAGTIGRFLLGRNIDSGAAAVNEALPDFGDLLKRKGELQGQIDINRQNYDFAYADKLEKKSEAVKAAKQESGVADVENAMSTMQNEHVEWRKNHDLKWPGRDDRAAIETWKLEETQYNDEFQKRWKELWDKSDELDKLHVRPVREKWSQELQQMAKDHNEQDDDLRAQQNEIDQKIGTTVLAKILESSPVTEEEADQWAKTQRVGKQALVRLKKNGYTEDALRRDMAEFYRLTGGRVGKAFIESKGDKRANAKFWDGVVYIDGNFTKKTLFHEMGHILEREPKFEHMAEVFRDSRAKPDKQKKSLRSLTKNTSYQSDEYALPDDFFDPYVGKVYNYSATEVMSMGMQMFSSPDLAASLALKDTQMFTMMMGFMLSKPTQRELANKEKIEGVATDQLSKADTLEKFWTAVAKKANSDTFWQGTQNAELIKEIQGTGSRDWRHPNKTNKGRSWVSFYYPDDPRGQSDYMRMAGFKTRQAARMFVYLYLLYIQKEIITSQQSAGSLHYEIQDAVQRKKSIPRIALEDMPTFLEDLK